MLIQESIPDIGTPADILWDVPIGGFQDGEGVQVCCELHLSTVQEIQEFATANDVTVPEIMAALAIRFAGSLREGGEAC